MTTREKPSHPDTCDQCFHWLEQDRDGLKGRCQFAPPVVIGAGTHWPETSWYERCGKYEAGVAPNAPTWPELPPLRSPTPPESCGVELDDEIAF